MLTGDQAYEEVLQAVKVCVMSSDPIIVSGAIMHAIEIGVDRSRMLPEFFSFSDLEKRWRIERKAVERLNLPRTKIGGSIRFARDDVMKFEHDHRLAY